MSLTDVIIEVVNEVRAEQSLKRKLAQAIEQAPVLESGLVENFAVVTDSGYWWTTCRNEYGGNYGTIREGRIDLSDEERELIGASFPYTTYLSELADK